MGGLVMMKLLRPDLFAKAKQGTMTLPEAKDFLHLKENGSSRKEMGWEEQWWTYCLASPLSAEFHDFAGSMAFRYGFNREEIIPYTANEVIDRLAPSIG